LGCSHAQRQRAARGDGPEGNRLFRSGAARCRPRARRAPKTRAARLLRVGHDDHDVSIPPLGRGCAARFPHPEAVLARGSQRGRECRALKASAVVAGAIPLSWFGGIAQFFWSMTMFLRTHTPGPPLSEFIDRFWFCSDTPSHPGERILPSGTVEMVINL